MIEQVCKECEKKFLAKDYVVKRGDGKYCSRACSDKARSTGQKRINANCEHCGNAFKPRLTDVKRGRGRFCSPACSLRHRTRTRVERACKRCGYVFYPEKREVDRGGGVYCSRSCYEEYLSSDECHFWNGGVNSGRELKERVRVRNLVSSHIRSGEISPEKCEQCGDKGEAHHDDYDKPFELRWLCRVCHNKFHKEQREHKA